MAYSAAATRVFEEWRDNSAVSDRAAKAVLAHVGRKGDVNRQEVAFNHEFLAPIIRHIGLRPSLESLMEATEMLLHHCRPRGKALPTRDVIRVEAWILRRLVFLFARVARRGHRPREHNIRLLMEAAGIPVPSSRESLADEPDPEAPDDEDAEDDGEPNGEPDVSMDEGQECSETEIEDDPEVEVDAKDIPSVATAAGLDKTAGHVDPMFSTSSGSSGTSAPTEPAEPLTSSPCPTPAGQKVEAHLRPGHYIVNNKEHGHECLRCGAVGYVGDIKSTPCSNPTGEPKYEEEDPSTGHPSATCTATNPFQEKFGGLPEGKKPTQQEIEDEIAALQLLEAELAAWDEVQKEKEVQEALEEEQLMLELQALELEEKELHRLETKDYKTKLLDEGFPEHIAAQALEIPESDRPKVLEKAHRITQEEEYQTLSKAEKEEAKKRTAGRPPASPCVGNSMPPPPVPKKPDISTEVSIDNIDTLPLDTQSAEDVSFHLSILPDKGCPAETGERQYFCKPMGSSDSLSTMHYDKTAKTPQQIKEAVKSKVEEGNPRPKDVLERVTSSISPTDQKQKFKEADNDEDEGENGDGGEKTAGSARGKGKSRGRGGKGRGRGRGRGKTPGKRSSSTSCKGCEKPNKKAKSGKGANGEEKDLGTWFVETRPTASEEPPSSTSKPRRRLRPLSEKPEDSIPEEDAKMPKTRKVSNKPEKDAKSSKEEASSSTCKPRRARKEKDARGSQEEPSSSTCEPRRARKEKDAKGSQEEPSSSASKPRRARKEKDDKGSQEEEPSPSTSKPRRARKGAEKPEDPKSEKGAKKSKKEPSSTTSKPREPRKISKKPASKRMRSKVKIEEETNQVNQETLGNPEMLESGPAATPAAPEPEGRPLRRRDDPEEKAKRSRKSSAYHVAKRAALKDGHSKEKALEMASQAYHSTL